MICLGVVFLVNFCKMYIFMGSLLANVMNHFWELLESIFCSFLCRMKHVREEEEGKNFHDYLILFLFAIIYAKAEKIVGWSPCHSKHKLVDHKVEEKETFARSVFCPEHFNST